MAAAPPRAASVPVRLTPPEVPFSTTLPLLIDRGSTGLRMPSSVAQVSALTAARVPSVAAHHRSVPGKIACATASNPAAPPLASTCPASRRLLLEYFSFTAALRCLNMRESTEDEAKKPTNRTAQAKPPSPKTAVPNRVAATAPESERLRAA